MSYDIKGFQLRYVLSNKEMADICKCSLPTIQKWRSGEVAVSGAAGQLLRMLDLSAEGNPSRLREILSKLDQAAFNAGEVRNPELEELESRSSEGLESMGLRAGEDMFVWIVNSLYGSDNVKAKGYPAAVETGTVVIPNIAAGKYAVKFYDTYKGIWLGQEQLEVCPDKDGLKVKIPKLEKDVACKISKGE